MPINVKNLHVGTSWVAIEISKVGDEQLSELTGGYRRSGFYVKTGPKTGETGPRIEIRTKSLELHKHSGFIVFRFYIVVRSPRSRMAKTSLNEF